MSNEISSLWGVSSDFELKPSHTLSLYLVRFRSMLKVLQPQEINVNKGELVDAVADKASVTKKIKLMPS